MPWFVLTFDRWLSYLTLNGAPLHAMLQMCLVMQRGLSDAPVRAFCSLPGAVKLPAYCQGAAAVWQQSVEHADQHFTYRTSEQLLHLGLRDRNAKRAFCLLQTTQQLCRTLMTAGTMLIAKVLQQSGSNLWSMRISTSPTGPQSSFCIWASATAMPSEPSVSCKLLNNSAEP